MKLISFALMIAGSVVTQEPPREAARLYAAYPQAQFSPIFRESLETFLRVEDAYRARRYSDASRILEAFWKKHPTGTEEWARASRDADSARLSSGVNIGRPPAYYALRMFTECLEWKLARKPTSKHAATAVMTVVLVDKAAGTLPLDRQQMEAGEGREARLALDRRLLTDKHRLIRESTWLFEQYVEAATEGELKPKIEILSLPDLQVPVAVTWNQRGWATLVGDAWSRIWKAVPTSQRRKTDWWWVIYPSAVPEGHLDFATAEFVTGGMGVGPDGGSPCFIIDDKWLVRRPPHLGRGTYTDVERRAYLPQWLQHEFFHHLFRIYPEDRLEVDGHDWFDLKKWPKDFQGRLEPDYYAEALAKRFKGSKPSLAQRLRYADPPQSVLRQVRQGDLLGEYVREPEENAWHRGKISLQNEDGGKLRWTNAAGRSWLLTPKLLEGILETGPDCPYYPQSPYFKVVLQRDEKGDHLPKVRGFSFGGGLYRKMGGIATPNK